MEKTNKVIMFPFVRRTNIENAVNTLNVALKDVQANTEESLENNTHGGYINISHELNNLISNIHGESQLIELFAQNEKLSNKPLTKSIDLIKQNCLKLTKALNNMIDLGKIKDGQYCLCLNKVNIVEILDDIVINVSKNIKDKKVIFDTNVEEKFMPCDINKFQRAILILLSNTVKFSGEKEIFVNLNIYENDVNIAISFKNQNSKLLNYFIDKMDNLKSNSLKDLSIGFYICKTIIQLHEGRINIGGNGEEICFSIQLPCKNTDSIYYLFRNDKILNHENLTEQIHIEFSDLYGIKE